MNSAPRKRPEDLRGHTPGPAPTTCAPSATARGPSRWATAAEDYAGKPVIGILNTWSDINTCHTHFPQRVRGGEARRLAGRRLPGRNAGDDAVASRS